MNTRQRRFAEFYAQSGNAEAAAVRAGYSKRFARGNAYKLVAISGVAEYIKAISDSESCDRILTAQQRQIILSDIIRDEENFTVAERLRAIDLLNRMTGAYQIKVDAIVEQSPKLAEVMDQLAQMSTEQLREIAYSEEN